ncbi:Bardet-Biedl syndrome 10 protein homolog isoform X2 [Acanthaster planci]|nr:Bardet-Biedl syndrome 10 protein homolog isoform X2 [Acanthaster planci]
MCQHLPVHLSAAVTICETIESLVRDSVGPNGLHTMLTSSSGSVVITGDGHTILSSLHLSHPIARWIVERIRCHHGITGDNSKSFVLIVTEILRRLQDAIGPTGASSSVSSKKRDLIEIGRALEVIQEEVFPQMVLPELLKHCMCLDITKAKQEEVMNICKKIVGTNLGGRFTPHVTEHMTKLTVDLVSGCCDDISSFAETIRELISEYNVTCIEVPNTPISKSKLLDGVVLTRNFAVQSEDLDSLTTVPFIILSCPLNKWTPDVCSTLAAGSKEDLSRFLQFETSWTHSLICHLREYGVKLLLSSELLSDATLSFCRAAGISAVHMIPEDELNRLARLTKTDIVHDPVDILTSALKRGTASFCRSVIVGRCVGVQLGFSNATVHSKQLVLCGPTQGICRQWFIAVLNALKTLQMWLDNSWLSAVMTTDADNVSRASNGKSEHSGITLAYNSAESLELSSAQSCSLDMQDETADGDNLESSLGTTSVCLPKHQLLQQQGICIPGGGCTEFLLHRIFRTLASGCNEHHDLKARDPSFITAAGILCEAALCIPRTLHRNSVSPQSKKSSFLEMASKVQDCSSLVGVNGRTGALCDPAERGILEPVSARYILWRDSVKMVQDLLKIDMILGVRAVPGKGCSNTSDDDSDG